MKKKRNIMKDKKELKEFPFFHSDEEAEHFVATADLTEYDFGDFVPVKFEFAKKSSRINMRISTGLLNRIKFIAREKGIPYTRYIREILESRVGHEQI